MNKYKTCPHCGGTADKFIGELDMFKRRQFGIFCDKCPAGVLLCTYPNKEPKEEDWKRAEEHWNKRI